MSNIAISIIVPVYNTEKYLEKCLDSLISQTLTNIEIIIINDDSTDNSLKILNKFILLDNRIKLINLENSKGPGNARNIGINISQGEYISFVDSDDYINHNMYQNMYNKVKEQNSDICFCNFYLIDENENILSKSSFKGEQKELNNLYLSNILSSNITTGIWAKIYKRKLISKNSILFDNENKYEDIMFSFLCSYHAKKITYLNEYHYYWLQLQNSRSKKISIQNIDDRINVMLDIKSFLINNNLYNDLKKDYVLGFTRHLYIYLYNSIIKYSINSDYLRSYFINKVNNVFTENILLKDYDYDLYIKVLKINRDYYLSELGSDFNKNLELSKKINNLFSDINLIKKNHNNIVIYGNGIVGNIILKELKDKAILICDKNNLKHSSITTCTPEELKEYNFEKIIITVLGRESEIMEELTNKHQISKSKILVFSNL